MSQQKQYMLIFTLGPVQTFIAQARKSRDLWLGSFLLSTLMEAGMSSIEQSALVFPTTPTTENAIPDLPNKFVALFETKEQAHQVVLRCKEHIEQCWLDICQDIWREIIETHARSQTAITREIWDRQTNPAHCFEMYWVIVAGDPLHYSHWLETTQAALDARKRLRNFVPQDEPGEKSTISGEREALRGAGEFRQDVRNFWYDLAQHVSGRDISQDGTERLDAIDTVKRYAFLSSRIQAKGLKAGFPSTSTIATAPFVAQLLQKPLDPAVLAAWLRATEKPLANTPTDALPYLKARAGKADALLLRDGDCFFPETFTPRRLHKDYGLLGNDVATQRRAEVCQQATQALLRATDQLGLPRPTPYYTLIQMDGDHMGTLLSGVQNRTEHVAISRALSHFSRQDVPRLVEEEHPARLIYAGGDDVLAISPLESLFQLANQLQEAYCAQVKKAVVDQDRQQKVTASMGVVIAHHLTPLAFVIRAARQAESLAKSQYGRNALVVTVLRRSGEQTRVGCRWYYDKPEIQPLSLIDQMYALFEKDVLSPKSVFLLLEEAPALVGLEREAQVSEIKRILRRQRNEKKQEHLPDERIEQLASALSQLAEAMDDVLKREHPSLKPTTELSVDEPRHGLVEVLGWLLVAVFLARKGGE
ncbi:MAG: type III-B CRISPR-associated protein Cas10/Cmr2 [Ktedonobacteraceae bacterium]